MPVVIPSSTLSAPPAFRRRRPLRAEPMVFAVMLALLTLGINLSDTPDTAEHAASQPASAQLSQVAAVH